MSQDPRQDPDLAPFLGAYEWERHLDTKTLEALALHRLVAEAEGYGEFGHSLSLANIWSSSSFQSDLEKAGDDPVARAYLYCDAEIEAYPFTLG